MCGHVNKINLHWRTKAMHYSDILKQTDIIKHILERLEQCETKLGMMQDKTIMVEPGDIVRAERDDIIRYYIVGRIGEEIGGEIRQYYILIDLLDGNRWSDVRIPFNYETHISLKRLVGDEGWQRYEWTLVKKSTVLQPEILWEDVNNA